MITVPTTETTSMNVVLMNAVSILPRTKAVTKLSTLSQLPGGDEDRASRLNSAVVLSEAITMTTSGMTAIRQATISDA